eukprot:scaffold5115_cov113-Isochrysis_galbana.AAC.5
MAGRLSRTAAGRATAAPVLVPAKSRVPRIAAKRPSRFGATLTRQRPCQASVAAAPSPSGARHDPGRMG